MNRMLLAMCVVGLALVGCENAPPPPKVPMPTPPVNTTDMIEKSKKALESGKEALDKGADAVEKAKSGDLEGAAEDGKKAVEEGTKAVEEATGGSTDGDKAAEGDKPEGDKAEGDKAEESAEGDK